MISHRNPRAMDLVLGVLDPYVMTPYVYPEYIKEDNWMRQFTTLWLLILFGGSLLYLIPATLSYHFMFDKNLMKHEKFIPGQVWLEIRYALWSVPWMGIPTCVLFVLELQGYSKLYDNVSDHPWGYGFLALNIVGFLLFTDMCIYWIHRWLHLPIFYGPIHKPHHRWLICTPFASHAFHPIDGFMQSLPYHLYAFIFPIHKMQYLVLFVLVNFWSTSIHDEVYLVPKFLRPFVNGSAHHTDHHLYFNYNFGQYFTLWDRLGSSFREPSAFEEGQSVYDELRVQLAEEARDKAAAAADAAGLCGTKPSKASSSGKEDVLTLAKGAPVKSARSKKSD